MRFNWGTQATSLGTLKLIINTFEFGPLQNCINPAPNAWFGLKRLTSPIGFLLQVFYCMQLICRKCFFKKRDAIHLSHVRILNTLRSIASSQLTSTLSQIVEKIKMKLNIFLQNCPDFIGIHHFGGHSCNNHQNAM